MCLEILLLYATLFFPQVIIDNKNCIGSYSHGAGMEVPLRTGNFFFLNLHTNRRNPEDKNDI